MAAIAEPSLTNSQPLRVGGRTVPLARLVATLGVWRRRIRERRALAELSERMIAAHGKDFSMGALVLAARFIAENRPFERHAATSQ